VAWEHRFVKVNGPITMETIARHAGVARSTVSKALRDDPTIPAKHCAEIKRLAEELGYRPNPMVSTLMAQLHGGRRRNDPYHIAWIDLWPDSTALPIMKPLLAGARRRADELGYNIELHQPIAEGINPDRLRQVLTTRSQWALIIPPVPESMMRYSLDLRGLAGVTVGTSLHEPIMHRVSPNHYQGAQLACVKLRAKGFHRIGIVLSSEFNNRVEGKWLGAFLSEQQLWPTSHRVRPLLIGRGEQIRFKRWLDQEEPDVILLAEPHVDLWRSERCGARSSPLPAAWLHLETSGKGVWHVDYHAEDLGAAAVELVIGQIHRNERGSPAIAHTLLLDSSWVE
jgi:LacI family transcriptional regulator